MLLVDLLVVTAMIASVVVLGVAGVGILARRIKPLVATGFGITGLAGVGAGVAHFAGNEWVVTGGLLIAAAGSMVSLRGIRGSAV